MPSLRSYRDRIKSVRSTRKITSAMKMVAASKLRRAEDQAKAARPYAERMARMMSTLAGKATVRLTPPLIITEAQIRDALVAIEKTLAEEE